MGEFMTEIQMLSAGLTATQIRYMKRYLEGATQKDIANEFCVVPSSVSHTMSEARKKLQAAGLQSERSYEHDLHNI